MSKKSEWDSPNVTVEEYKKLINDLNYQRYFSRWPVVDSDLRNMALADYYQIVWAEYAKILNDVNGIDTVQSIKKLIQSELKDIQQNLDDYPKDADKVYDYRLKHNRNLLEMRSSVIDRLLTQYAIHGKIKQAPEFDLRNAGKLNINEIQALDNVCRNAQKENKRDLLTEYLHLSKSMVKKKIRDQFHEKYKLPEKTFYQWTQALDKEIKSITRTEK